MMDTAVFVNTIWQPRLAKGPKPMRVWGKEGITWPCIAAGGRDRAEARVALATDHRLLREAVGYPNPYGGSSWVEIGNGRSRRKIESTGARVGNASVGRRKFGGIASRSSG
jgi:hypothetical protein